MEGYFEENETGEIFMVLEFGVLNTTGAGAEMRMVFYVDGLGGKFVKEEMQFFVEFTKIEDHT